MPLGRLGYRNLYVRAGDGYLGWLSDGDFQASLVQQAYNQFRCKRNPGADGVHHIDGYDGLL